MPQKDLQNLISRQSHQRRSVPTNQGATPEPINQGKAIEICWARAPNGRIEGTQECNEKENAKGSDQRTPGGGLSTRILKKWMCIQTKLNEPLQTGRGGRLLSPDAPGGAKEELTIAKSDTFPAAVHKINFPILSFLSMALL